MIMLYFTVKLKQSLVCDYDTSVGRRVAITIIFSVEIRFDNPFEIPTVQSEKAS